MKIILDELKEAVMLMKKAQKILKNIGFNNILQPGLIKEMIIADKLNHEVHKTKHNADAFAKENPEEKYEYLTCLGNKGSFQLDRMFKFPKEERIKSLSRISRNKYIYCIIFYKDNPLEIEKIYRVNPEVMVREAERQLENSKNNISHISFSVKWVIENGKEV